MQEAALEKETAEDQREDSPVTSLVGREVYTKEGVYVGQVSDLNLDFSSCQVSDLVVHRSDVNKEVISLEPGMKGILIPYNWISSVGDIVLASVSLAE